LALHEPQLQAAEASLAAARSARAQAELSVGKTNLRAPFNAWVQSEFVEVGQLVGPQSQIATLVGTDAYWVQVSVPAEQLRALTLPGQSEDAVSSAVVKQNIGTKTVVREGKLLRLLGDLDPVGRLVRLLVEVDDPLNLASNADETRSGSLPLLLGAYVSVEFEGQSLDNVVQVPRSALREGDKVFVYGPNDTLVIRPVEVTWRMPDTVLVSNGLDSGEHLITTRIATPIEGMKLRRKDSAEATSATGGTPTAEGAAPLATESATPQ
jgi:RND family efflux transporter MFP subunit